jgi:hypothetical protein
METTSLIQILEWSNVAIQDVSEEGIEVLMEFAGARRECVFGDHGWLVTINIVIVPELPELPFSRVKTAITHFSEKQAFFGTMIAQENALAGRWYLAFIKDAQSNIEALNTIFQVVESDILIADVIVQMALAREEMCRMEAMVEAVGNYNAGRA